MSTNIINYEPGKLFVNSLPAITPKITFDGIFLLMLGIHAKYVPWTMTNITRVDAKRECSI